MNYWSQNQKVFPPKCFLHFMSSLSLFTSTLSHINFKSCLSINQSHQSITSLKVTFDLTLDVTNDLTLDVTCVAALEFEIRMRSQSHSGSVR